MASEEVISCPSCRHALRVPANWLGTEVQCPECKSMFRAPLPQGDGRLGESVLLAGNAAPRRPRRPDWLLMLPAFGLMLTGAMGIFVAGVFLFVLSEQREDLREQMIKEIPKYREQGMIPKLEPGEDPKKVDGAIVDELMDRLQTQAQIGIPMSAVAFLGGVLIVIRRGYPLAILSCIVATVNFPFLCCLPGAVFGIWSLVLMVTGEGREHFRRAS